MSHAASDSVGSLRPASTASSHFRVLNILDRQPSATRSPHIGIAVRWGVAVIAMFVGIGWFLSQNLQNNAQFSRLNLSFLLPEMLGEFVSPSAGPDDQANPSGWQYFPERLPIIIFAVGLLAMSWSWGDNIIRLLIPPDQLSDRGERFYWSLVTGLAIWGTLTLLLGLMGALYPVVFFLVGWAPIIYGIVTRKKVPPLACQKAVAVKHRWSGLGIACSIAVAPFLLAMLLGSLLPPWEFDVREYHLGGAKEFYQRGRIEMLPHNVYTSFPFLTEMLCLSGMVLKRDWFTGAQVGQVVLATFAPLTALGLFVAARRWIGTTAAWFAVLIHLTCPWTYRISIIAYAEGGLACFLFATFFAALRSIEATTPRTARRWTLLTGLLAGAAAGCKYPAALTVVIPLGLLLLIGQLWPRLPLTPSPSRPLSHLLRNGLIFTLGVLTTFGPWLGKNLCETGNPVYPLLYSVFGGADWDDASNAKWKAGHPLPLKDITSIGWLARDTKDRLWDVFLGSDWQSGLYLALAVAALMAIWQARPTQPGRLATRGVLLLSFGYFLWLFWTWQYFTHRIDRFWVPMLPICSLLAGAGLATLWESVSDLLPNRTREVYFLIRSPIALSVLGMVLFNLALATSGLGGNNAYLMEFAAFHQKFKTRCVEYVDSLNLAPNSKVLFVGEAELFDAKFPYEYNTVFDHSIFERDCSADQPGVAAAEQPLRPAQEILDAWRARGITHVVVNWREILRYRTTYGYTNFVHPSRFKALVDAGVLIPDSRFQPIELDKLPPERQDEIARWAPELQYTLPPNPPMVKLYETYRVAP